MQCLLKIYTVRQCNSIRYVILQDQMAISSLIDLLVCTARWRRAVAGRAGNSQLSRANKSRSMKLNEANSSMTVIEVFAWLAFTFHVHLRSFLCFFGPLARLLWWCCKNVCHCDNIISSQCDQIYTQYI